MTDYWRPGDQVMLRYREFGPPAYSMPVTVVEDGPKLNRLYLAEGTPIKLPALPNGEVMPHDDRPFIDEVGVADGVWQGTNVLMLTPPDAAHSVWPMWNATDWTFLGWYVNLQSPLRRVSVGFDSDDFELDVWIAADGKWRWKDEALFDQLVERGRIAPRLAKSVRCEGQRVIADFEANRWPFNAGYEHWRPDPTWSMPTIPYDWDRE